jgi:hypothetical protein
MPDVTTVEAPEQVSAPELDTQDEQAQDEAPEQDERQLNALLRKAESAFTKGNKGLLMSRIECGKWCHAVYVLRAEQGNKDRSFTSQLIFNRLAVHADSRRECDASELAKMYKLVELLSDGSDTWKALTVGKIIDMLPLIQRVDGTELYACFDKAKADQCKAVFAWACGDGLHRRSREDIAGRVLELTDPAKYAAKEAAEAAKKEAAKQGDAADQAEDAEDEPEVPENLIPTEPSETRPMPDWKDIGENMDALWKEAVKQQPGRTADVMADFAKRVDWTMAAIKGLVAGIADGKNGDKAEQALQNLVDNIAEEYSIFPASELAEAA